MKHRGWKKIGIISGIIAIVLILVVIIVPRLIDLNRYNHFIVSQVEKTIGGEVTLGRISWGISHGIWLEIDGVSIREVSVFPGDIELSRIYTHVSIPPLLKKKVVLNKLLLDGVEVKVKLVPGALENPAEKEASDKPVLVPEEKEDRTNGTEEIVSPGVNLEPTDFQMPVQIEIEEFVVKIDQLEFDDTLTIPGQTQVRVYRELEMTARHIVPGEDVAFELSLGRGATSDFEELSVQGTFRGLTDTLKIENPGLRLNARITALQIDAVKPYLKNSSLQNQLEGSVSLEVNYEGDLTKNHYSEGVIDLTHITYENPALFNAALPGRKTALIYGVKLDSKDLTVEKLGLKLGDISLNARVDVQDWRKDPVIKNVKISSDLPLVNLIPLIPWPLLGANADLVREICREGGNIELSNVFLPEIQLSKLPKNLADLLPKIKLAASFDDITMPMIHSLPKIEGISGRVNLEDGVLSADKIQAEIGPISLPTISIRVTNIAHQPKVALRAEGSLQVGATRDEKVENILQQYGLKSVTGSAEINMNADYDQRKPENWTADGLLTLKGIRAEAYPSNTVLENLQGEIQINRKQTINIIAKDVTANINQAPVRISGIFTDIGSPEMLISAKVFSKKLDMGNLAELLPALGDYELDGILDVDLDVHVPYATLEKSRVNGTVTTRDTRFRVAGSNLTVEKGDADITLNGNAADIKKMTLQVNGQQVALSGNFTGIGTPGMLISAKVYGDGLDLASLAELLPVLSDLKLDGALDLDLDAYVPFAALEKSRINGTVTAHDTRFLVAGLNLTVEKGNAEIELRGNAVDIRTMTLQVNGQQVTLSGQISDPDSPKVQLLVSSPGLDLDRILPPAKDGKPSLIPSNDNGGQVENEPVPEEKPGSTELPPLARKLTANLQVKSDSVQYSGSQFQNLNLKLLYEHGVVKNYDIHFGIDDGTVALKGNTDLRNLDHIPFVLDSDINKLQLKKVAPLLGIDELSINGPVSLQGHLRGRTGNSEELMASLDGDFTTEIGPGVLNNIGAIGNLLVKIFSITSAQGILSGRTIENLNSEGLPFQSIKNKSSFANGSLNLKNLDFKSDTMTVNSQGTIDLINQELLIAADLVPFSIADKTLGFIPIIGDTAQSLTQVHLEIKGPLDDPEIHAAPIKRIVKDLANEPVNILKGIGKGLKKLIPNPKEGEGTK